MRIDQLIVQQGLAPSRSAAQRLIVRGAVRWRAAQGWAVPRKAGDDLPEGCVIEVTDAAEVRYVSRGGLKLDGALAHCGLTLAGATCLDVGQGSGGFTDVLLQRGAARVVGIDVGHAQLHAKLRADARVECFEGLNARDVTASTFEARIVPHSFDLVVADVAFISLTLILPTLVRYVAEGGHALLLVKPQFELQPGDIGKGGIVKGASAYPRVEQRIRLACAANSLEVRDYFASSIVGGDGNREFFVWAQPARGAKP